MLEFRRFLKWKSLWKMKLMSKFETGRFAQGKSFPHLSTSHPHALQQSMLTPVFHNGGLREIDGMHVRKKRHITA